MHRVGYYPETILDFIKASSMLDIRDTLQLKKKKIIGDGNFSRVKIHRVDDPISSRRVNPELELQLSTVQNLYQRNQNESYMKKYVIFIHIKIYPIFLKYTP